MTRLYNGHAPRVAVCTQSERVRVIRPPLLDYLPIPTNEIRGQGWELGNVPVQTFRLA